MTKSWTWPIWILSKMYRFRSFATPERFQLEEIPVVFSASFYNPAKHELGTKYIST